MLPLEYISASTSVPAFAKEFHAKDQLRWVWSCWSRRKSEYFDSVQEGDVAIIKRWISIDYSTSNSHPGRANVS